MKDHVSVETLYFFPHLIEDLNDCIGPGIEVLKQEIGANDSAACMASETEIEALLVSHLFPEPEDLACLGGGNADPAGYQTRESAVSD